MAGSTKAAARARPTLDLDASLAAAAPVGDTPTPPGRAKLFANGRSQAVRLPKEFRLPGVEVLVRREGSRLILEPLDAQGWPVGLWDRLDELAEGLGDAWKRPPDPVPPPIRAERDLP
jgi:antitoxin VapB